MCRVLKGDKNSKEMNQFKLLGIFQKRGNRSGEIPSGEIPSGECPSGEIPSGESPSGESEKGEKNFRGKTFLGKNLEWKCFSGETSQWGKILEGNQEKLKRQC